MIKTKLLAMCVCPTLAAPPAILAVSPHARHAVADVMHRAANNLDHHLASLPSAPQFAALPCAPSLAATDGGLPVVASGGSGLGSFPGLTGIGAGANQLVPSQIAFGGSGYGIGGYVGGGYGGGGYIGGGGAGGSLPGSLAAMLAGGGSGMSSAPEPAAWLLMVTGFGIVGGLIRFKRIVGPKLAGLAVPHSA